MLVVTDKRINRDSLSALVDQGFEPVMLDPAEYLSEPVSGHTDMLIFIGFGSLFCHSRYYGLNKSVIDRISDASRSKITLSDEATGDKYPLDVLFNGCVIGNRLVCNEKTISNHILDAARGYGYEIIGVPQGYAKCSICTVSDNAIITADKSIAAACASRGIDVLNIAEGHISLPPYSYGFVGGASGAFGDKVYFCGSLDRHPDGETIKEFCRKHKKTAVSLSNGDLQDAGSLFFIGE